MPKLSYYEFHQHISAFIATDPKLGAVDRAFNAYSARLPDENDEKLQTLARALQDWKAAKARNEIPSGHDFSDLIEELYEQEVEAQKALRRVQNEGEISFQKICKKYGPLELESRPSFLDKLKDKKWLLTVPPAVYKVLAVARLSRGTAPTQQTPPGGAPGFVKSFVQKITDGAIAGVSDIPSAINSEVTSELQNLLPGMIGKVAASFVPFASELKEAFEVLEKLKTTIKEEIAIQKISGHTLAVGTPQKAIDAMLKVMHREQNVDMISGSQGLANYCVHVGTIVLTALKAAPIPGSNLMKGVWEAANGLFQLGNAARIIARDVTEKKAANALLSKLSEKDIGVQVLFETSPILGAYYVCCVPGSVLVNKIFDSWKFPLNKNEQDQIAKCVHHDGALVKKARELIQAHRFEIKGLQKCPGVLTSTYPTPVEKALQFLVVDYIGADQDRRPLGK